MLIVGPLTNYTIDIIGITVAVVGFAVYYWSRRALKESDKRWLSISRKIEWVIILSVLVGELIIILVFKDGNKLDVVPYVLIFVAAGIGYLCRLSFIKKHGVPPEIYKQIHSTEEKTSLSEMSLSDIFGKPDVPAGRLYEEEEEEIKRNRKA